MPVRFTNRHAHKMALENGWYCRFDPEVNHPVSCDKDASGASVDIIRAYEFKNGRDRGPITAEMIRNRKPEPYRFDTAGIGRNAKVPH